MTGSTERQYDYAARAASLRRVRQGIAFPVDPPTPLSPPKTANVPSVNVPAPTTTDLPPVVDTTPLDTFKEEPAAEPTVIEGDMDT